MSWSGGTYTKGNAGTGGWTGDASLGIGIEAGRHDTQDDDFATGINQCLNKDGSNSCTGDLNLGGFKPVNLAAGTAAAPAICAGGDVNTGIFSAASDQIGIATNGTERVRVDSTGKVGIGTTTPSVDVDIQGTATQILATRFSADTIGARLDLQKSRGASVGTNTIVSNGDILGAVNFWGANGSGYTIAAQVRAEVDGAPGATNDMPGRLIFSTTLDGTGGNAERMRIDNTGNVGIGANISNTRLLVRGVDATASNIAFYCQNSTPAVLFVVRNDGLIDTGLQANSPYNRGTATPVNMTVGGDGFLYRNTSGLKYKRDIENATHGLAEVLQLRPVTYKGKSDIDGNKVFGGLIAEEVHAAGLTEFVIYNADGEPDALGYGNMVSLAFKAIQELNAKVEALEARVAELEAA